MDSSTSVIRSALPCSILIIGYGNQLLCDDAIGPRIADEVAIWRVPNVRSLTVHQLTPELAAELAKTESVIFIDACRLNYTQMVRVTPIEAMGSETTGSTVPALGHSCDPHSLLALTQSVYGHYPQAWWVEVPAVDFAVGEHLSNTAEQGIAEALEAIHDLIQTNLHPPQNETSGHA